MKKNQKTQEVAVEVPTQEVPTQAPAKVETIRKYKYQGTQPEKPKGQVTSVLKALEELKEGTLQEFVAKVNELDPGYKTKTPIEASVKFHLHLLSRKGHVQEVNVPKEEAQA